LGQARSRRLRVGVSVLAAPVRWLRLIHPIQDAKPDAYLEQLVSGAAI